MENTFFIISIMFYIHLNACHYDDALFSFTLFSRLNQYLIST